MESLGNWPLTYIQSPSHSTFTWQDRVHRIGVTTSLAQRFLCSIPGRASRIPSHRMDTFQRFHDRTLINASLPPCRTECGKQTCSYRMLPCLQFLLSRVVNKGVQEGHPPSTIALSELLQPRAVEARGSPGSKTGYSPLLQDLPSVSDVRSGCPLHNSRHFSAQGREVAPRVPEGTTLRTALTAA